MNACTPVGGVGSGMWQPLPRFLKMNKNGMKGNTPNISVFIGPGMIRFVRIYLEDIPRVILL